jgi:hypothetical protein
MPFNRKDHHNFGEIRPRFKLLSSLAEEEIFRRLKEFVQADETVDGKKVYDQFYLDIPLRYRHFWSPELRILVEKYETDPSQTLIRVTVGPQFHVWLTFILTYAVLGLISLFGGMYGLVQLDLGIDSPWVWCLPVTILIFLGVWVSAKMGQRASRDETLHLASVLYHALGHNHAIRVVS